MSDQTTPRPWRVVPMWNTVQTPKKIVAGHRRTVVVAVGDADAALIVEAVNGWGDPDILRQRLNEFDGDQS